MSNDSKPPENPPNRDPSDFSKDFVGFGENDLWELDENPSPQSPPPINQPTSSDKSYGVMEKTEDSSEDSESPLTQAESYRHSPKASTKLSLLEKTSLLAIAAALIITAVLTVIHFSEEIPVDSLISKKVSPPVDGKNLTVTAVETYWRKPITQGDNPDIVRRGVELIPVIKIQTKGNSGAIRIFFRDSEGTLVGDSTTLAISGTETHQISATDGFTDMGMHASYRTGENPRWMIQVLEGPSADAPLEKFQPLFETEISTNIR